jgi:hypothetical protein
MADDVVVDTTAMDSTDVAIVEESKKDDPDAKRKRKRTKKDTKGKGFSPTKKRKVEPKWDSKMSATPDLTKGSNSSPIKHRVPVLVDDKKGVVTPSLLLRFVNIFPCGIENSIFRDCWLNNEFVGKLDQMAMTYNGSDSKFSPEYLSNYFRGVIDNVGIYIYLSSIQQICERSIQGEFDSDEKLKDSVEKLNRFFIPKRTAFRDEMTFFRQQIENYFLPPELLRLAEETYSPKFSKFAGIRTIELMGLTYPIHPSILCYRKDQSEFKIEEYCKEEKMMVSLFIDSNFWDDVSGKLEGFSVPRRSAERVVNFVTNTRFSLQHNNSNEKGEFIGLHEIMNAVVPEFSLKGKLKDRYDVVSISEGGRFARINNAQNYLDTPTYVQNEVPTVYSVYSKRRTTKEWFGSVLYTTGSLPLLEESSTYRDEGSNFRNAEGRIIKLTFDSFEAYHSTRGTVAELKGMENLKLQFGFSSRKSDSESDKEDYCFDQRTIQPGLLVKLPDRNGGSWLYSIESDYTDAPKNIVNWKPEPFRWFNSIEQPKYSKLTISEEALSLVVNSKMVKPDGSGIEGIDVEPDTINDSEMVACYYDLNVVKYDIGETVKEIWRSPKLIERILEFPNGPTTRFIEDIK